MGIRLDLTLERKHLNVQLFFYFQSQIRSLEDVLHPLSCEKVMFAFERSYITSEVRKSMLNMPVAGSF